MNHYICDLTISNPKIWSNKTGFIRVRLHHLPRVRRDLKMYETIQGFVQLTRAKTAFENLKSTTTHKFVGQYNPENLAILTDDQLLDLITQPSGKLPEFISQVLGISVPTTPTAVEPPPKAKAEPRVLISEERLDELREIVETKWKKHRPHTYPMMIELLDAVEELQWPTGE